MHNYLLMTLLKLNCVGTSYMDHILCIIAQSVFKKHLLVDWILYTCLE